MHEELYNFKTYVARNSANNDKRLIYYEWIADTGTTLHICSDCNSFMNYTLTTNISILGAGGKKTLAVGQGTVELISVYNSQKFILCLTDVLHVPRQKTNLISLGRWDASRGHYIGGKSGITLMTKDKTPVAFGRKLWNNLYKMKVTLHKPAEGLETTLETFMTQDIPTWETWHRRFGHVGYSGLEKLPEGGMVQGFVVDKASPKPDCIA